VNAIVNALFDEYLKQTGDKAAAAALTLADVMQTSLDAKTAPAVRPGPTTREGMLNLAQAAAYLGYTAHGQRKIVVRTQASHAGQHVSGPNIEFFQSRKRGTILFRREWLDEFIAAHRVLPGTPALPKVRKKSLRPASAAKRMADE